jgi:hypothetical protein
VKASEVGKLLKSIIGPGDPMSGGKCPMCGQKVYLSIVADRLVLHCSNCVWSKG